MTTAFAPAHAGVPIEQKHVKTSLPREFLDGARPSAGDEPLATFLGLFSIGLGLWEAAAPRDVADRTGVRFPGIVRAYGFREIASGLGILANRRPAGALWSRVAGDIVDLATIAGAYAQAGEADRRKNCLAAAAVAGVTLLDVLAATRHSASAA